MTIANYSHKRQLGYYIAGPGVGRETAFTTPLAEDPEYGETYGKAVVKAFRAVEARLRPDEKFVVFVVGDAEGLMFRAVAEELFVHADTPVNPQKIEVVVLDQSPALLQKQQAIQEKLGISGLQVTSRAYDARYLGTLLAEQYAGRTGMLVAEELVDVFPTQVVRLENGLLQELVYHIGKDGRYETVWQQVSDADATAINMLRQIFPYYDTLLTNFNSKLGHGRMVPINWGFIEMIFSLNQSPTNLYLMLGDYTSSWHLSEQGFERGSYPLPVRSFSFPPEPEDAIPYLRKALRSMADTTADVDFNLLTLGSQIQLDLLDSAAVVMHELIYEQPTTRPEIIDQVTERVEELTPGVEDHADAFIYLSYLQKFGYLERSMAIARIGNVPAFI
jgi:SAM-dependent MidA family methyltransferase